MSTEILNPQIYALIPKVMKDIGSIAKDHKNETQKYRFRGIEDFYFAAQPAMVEHGIFCAPEVLEREEYRFEKTNEYGKVTTWLHVNLKVIHRFYAGDGSFIAVTTCGEGLDNSDKATNKAMSGAMKYAFIELFSVPTQDVEDADRTSPEAGVRRNTNVERTQEDIPVDRPKPNATEEATITVEQARKLHLRFKDEIKEELKPQADQHLHDFLNAQKYVKDGKPSANAIPKSEYARIGKAAVEYAKGL